MNTDYFRCFIRVHPWFCSSIFKKCPLFGPRFTTPFHGAAFVSRRAGTGGHPTVFSRLPFRIPMPFGPLVESGPVPLAEKPSIPGHRSYKIDFSIHIPRHGSRTPSLVHFQIRTGRIQERCTRRKSHFDVPSWVPFLSGPFDLL